MGTLRIDADIDTAQFWSQGGDSDADTLNVTVRGMKFNGKPTSFYKNAFVKGRGKPKPIISKKGILRVRLQGVDAPELHYPTGVSKAKAVAANGNFRQRGGSTAAIELAKALVAAGAKPGTPVRCTLTSEVEHPNDVFDMYGRCVAEVEIKKIQVNDWLLRHGWAAPTFYASMTNEEIERMTGLAETAKAKKVGLWKSFRRAVVFDPELTHARNSPVRPDTGPWCLPKLFRRAAVQYVSTGSAAGLSATLAGSKTDKVYEVNEYLEQGAGAATREPFADYVVNNKLTVDPSEIAFKEGASTRGLPGSDQSGELPLESSVRKGRKLFRSVVRLEVLQGVGRRVALGLSAIGVLLGVVMSPVPAHGQSVRSSSCNTIVGRDTDCNDANTCRPTSAANLRALSCYALASEHPLTCIAAIELARRNGARLQPFAPVNAEDERVIAEYYRDQARDDTTCTTSLLQRGWFESSIWLSRRASSIVRFGLQVLPGLGLGIPFLGDSPSRHALIALGGGRNSPVSGRAIAGVIFRFTPLGYIVSARAMIGMSDVSRAAALPADEYPSPFLLLLGGGIDFCGGILGFDYVFALLRRNGIFSQDGSWTSFPQIVLDLAPLTTFVAGMLAGMRSPG